MRNGCELFETVHAADEKPKEHVEDIQVDVHGRNDVLVRGKVNLDRRDVPEHPAAKYDAAETDPEVARERLRWVNDGR